jgi:hypothetical protein
MALTRLYTMTSPTWESERNIHQDFDVDEALEVYQVIADDLENIISSNTFLESDKAKL